MKKLLALLVFGLLSLSSIAQIYDPVDWKFSVKDVNGENATLVITANIEPGWHVYSQFIDEGGPIPTSFKFEPDDGYSIVGTVKESPEAISAFDPNFNMQIAWHKTKVDFTQKIKLNEPKLTVSGTLEFMTCNDTNCLPPEEVPFSVVVDASASFTKPNSAPLETTNTAEAVEQVVAAPTINGSDTLEKDSVADSAVTIVDNAVSIDSNSVDSLQSVSSNNPDDTSEERGLWAIFVAGLIGGFAAFLMPCIYPMVPLTTSFFTKQSGSRRKGIWNAIIYGLSIIVIYVALGMVITLIFGASALNQAASSAWFNLAFFVIIVIFAVSFLGAFEITLPSRFVNKIDSQSNRGGLIGIFFMAFTLALVSFSCTGPIIGYLLVEAVSKGSLLGPAVGMFGFSVALAIPFIIFALFPAFLKEMPKSGGWLNTIKVSLGFLELALAFKFLSNVDLAYHWGILDREVFLAIWIVIFAIFGFYLLGKIRLSEADEIKIISLPRLFVAMLILTFTVYMIPGLWGAPLKGISAWLPPQPTQDFDLNKLTYGGLTNADPKGTTGAEKKYSDIFHAPHGLDAYYDYNEGLAYARSVNKPVLIDFTGWSCVNCRKMEASVWPEPEVLRRLKEDYVLISLYVDDRTELDESEKYVSEFSGKKISRVGQKWSDMQAAVYGTNSQPYYVIVDHDGNKLVPPQAFNLDVRNYVDFLDSGVEMFKKNN
ncbi:protein-disulfide reductase DsbD family protein [Albibacterium indicum]|uniref:protein-disulfide reductase DsbD family protein n=1 Tax=Albibacterium indicum TaxID=2292082 RepID=UPI000E4AAEBA|nr:thioredoxin family protein [Pedobacter indicus]